MVQIDATTSTPILISKDVSLKELESEIESTISAVAPTVLQHNEIRGLSVKWDDQRIYPGTTKIETSNVAATLALLEARLGRDMLTVDLVGVVIKSSGHPLHQF